MARPEAQIDLAELKKLCGMQCTDEEIAAFFGVSARTIERRRKTKQFNEIMERSRAEGRVSVRRSLFRLAGGGNIAAAIFLAKNLLGATWSPTSTVVPAAQQSRFRQDRISPN